MTRIRLGVGEWAFAFAVCWHFDLRHPGYVACAMGVMAAIYDWIELEQRR